MRLLLSILCLFLIAAAKPSKIELPLIGTLLNSPAKDYQARMLGRSEADRFTAATGRQLRGTGFILNWPGATAVEIEAEDDRIISVGVVIPDMFPSNAGKIDKLISGSDPRVKVIKEDCPLPRYPKAVRIIFTVVPVEVYIFDNKSKQEIAEGLRTYKWCAGMTFIEQQMANDGPGVYRIVVSRTIDPSNLRVREVSANQINAVSSGGEKIFTVMADGRQDAIDKVTARMEAGEEIQSLKIIKAK